MNCLSYIHFYDSYFPSSIACFLVVQGHASTHSCLVPLKVSIKGLFLFVIFCNARGHIKPNCFKFMNYMKKVIFSNFSAYGKSRKTTRPRVYLNNNKPRQAWVRKSNLNAFGANTC